MKIRPVGAELFHADGWTEEQTDKTNQTVPYRNFRTRLKGTELPQTTLNSFALVREQARYTNPSQTWFLNNLMGVSLEPTPYHRYS